MIKMPCSITAWNFPNISARQRQAVQGGGGNTVHVGITINNGQFTTADAKRVARMVNKELGMAYR